jgi:hypothetical protein
MSEGSFHKDRSPLDHARETSGIYKLGFEPESFIGFMAPFVIVIGVGGVLGFLIWYFL